jgi:hypothetical protein
MGTPQSCLTLRRATLEEVMDKKWIEKVRIEGRNGEEEESY